MTIQNLFSVNGYWKDDLSTFENYIVTDSDGDFYEGSDDEIFYYGISENEIIDAINKGEDTINDFVITSYQKIN